MTDFDPKELRRAARAIRKLKRIQREVLLMSSQEGLDYYQIGERLDLTVAQVQRHLADALYNMNRIMTRRHWWRR